MICKLIGGLFKMEKRVNIYKLNMVFRVIFFWYFFCGRNVYYLKIKCCFFFFVLCFKYFGFNLKLVGIVVKY